MQTISNDEIGRRTEIARSGSKMTETRSDAYGSEVVHFSRANGVAAHYEYAPFGEVTAQVRQGGVTDYDFAALNPWRFSSECAEDATGLVYYNYRFYNQITGRWCSRDPQGDADSCVYLMVYNDPVNIGDMLGLEPLAIEICESGKMLAENSDQYKEIVAQLKKNKCSVIVGCGCCNAGEGLYGKATGESYDNRELTLCTDGANKNSTDYRETYIHELIHALDHCKAKKNAFSCDETICTEIRAYSEDGSCRDGGAYRLPGETERQCIERGALNSVLGRGTCSNKRQRSIKESISKSFGRCVSKGVRDRVGGRRRK